MKKDVNSNNLQEIFDSNVLKLLKHVVVNSKIAVAVSGGPDSMGLVFLLKNYFQKTNIKIIALVVNHNIRDDSLNEASLVVDYLKKNYVEAYILNRKKINFETKIQEQARNDRYKMLVDYCKLNSINALAVGHHLDDDVETYLMRNEYDDSFIGNAGISAKTKIENVLVIRPLLNVRKRDILNYMKCKNLFFVEDPSNQNTKFLRVKIRQKIENINNNRFVNVVNNIKINSLRRMILENLGLKILFESGVIEKFAAIHIDKNIFLSVDDDLKMMVLYAIIKFIFKKNYLNLKSIRLLISNISKVNVGYTYSLSNILIIVGKNTIIFIKEFRENKDIVKFFDIILNKHFDASQYFLKKNDNNILEICYNDVSCRNLLKKNQILKKQLLMMPSVCDEKGFNIEKTVIFYNEVLNNKFYNLDVNYFFKI